VSDIRLPSVSGHNRTASVGNGRPGHGTTMAVTIAAWRMLWYLGSRYEQREHPAPIASDQDGAAD